MKVQEKEENYKISKTAKEHVKKIMKRNRSLLIRLKDL